MPFIAFGLLLTLILGGGATLAAERAQPGDALYSVKADLNSTIGAAVSPIAAQADNLLSLHLTSDAAGSGEQDMDSATSSASADVNSNDDGMVSGGTALQAHGTLRVRGDTGDESALDAHTDGGVNVKL